MLSALPWLPPMTSHLFTVSSKHVPACAIHRLSFFMYLMVVIEYKKKWKIRRSNMSGWYFATLSGMQKWAKKAINTKGGCIPHQGRMLHSLHLRMRMAHHGFITMFICYKEACDWWTCGSGIPTTTHKVWEEQLTFLKWSRYDKSALVECPWCYPLLLP